jgi:2-keto-4-pentenoate hydratase/2-oxohepta-3-ene-1,7-dioic acid hydratase in catechol pathway
MKIARIQVAEQNHWAELEGETLHLLAGMQLPRTGQTVLLSQAQLLAPATPSKIVCVGRNYLDHIKEMGNLVDDTLPKEPGLFLKAPNTLANPGSSVAHPDWTTELHFEGELALVIGKRAKNILPEDAPLYIFGYTCALDLTARDKQKADLQWTRGKSADDFCPLGPWLETDLDSLNVSVQTKVNGAVRQEASTQLMIFDVPQIVAYISSFMTLEPGDVVLTGTPAGVGKLERGDRVQVTVSGIGTLETEIC